MRLSFIGDVNFRNNDDITFKRAQEILQQAEDALKDTDFRIVNLETPLAVKEKYEPIPKSGPNHIYSPRCISFLKALKTNAAVLANNHLGDYGHGALRDTLQLLDDNDIMHAGAGENIYEAYKAVHIEQGGMKAAIISVCENEFGTAGEKSSGTAGYRPRLLLEAIKNEKGNGECVIVVFHGGNEFNPLPSPGAVERYRMICDMGADAVVAMHTHCPQGWEIYKGKPIVYSLGNFMFQSGSPREEKDSWYYGYICHLDIREENKISLGIVPYKFDISAKIKIFEGSEKVLMMEYLNKISEIIQEPDELRRYYMGWCCNHQWFLQIPDQYGGLQNHFADAKNLLTCEAHYEMLKENYRILNDGDENIAEEYAKRIAELSKMPV